MKSLLCQAGGCAHNVKGQCKANTIQVNSDSEQTFCDTYVHEDRYLENVYSRSMIFNLFDLEFGEEAFASPKIMCNVAQCAYNRSFRCRAKDVEIDNPNGYDMCHCLTFKQK